MSLLFVLLVVSLLICINAWKSNNNVRMKCNNNNIIMSNDKFFGKQLTKSVVALLSTVVISTSPVNAAASKSPLFLGGSYAEVIDPKDASFNDELKNSEDVKAGVSGLNDLIKTVQSIKADLAKNSNVDLTGRVSKDLNVGKVRSVLNKYNQAFSEDTQRGTDRLIRGIVQDIQEIERDIVVKEGKARSESKIKNLSKRLDATEAAFKDLAAFYK
jgi:hypothetical protein